MTQAIKLPRNRTLTITNWLNDYEFMGTISWTRRWQQGDEIFVRDSVEAAYGWAHEGRGTAWNIYSVGRGSIQKEGTIKRAVLRRESND